MHRYLEAQVVKETRTAVIDGDAILSKARKLPIAQGTVSASKVFRTVRHKGVADEI